MKIIDISWPITEGMTAYKDHKVVKIEATKDFERDGVREHKVTLGTHTGTHIDSPAHFLRDGITVDQIPFDRLVGECRVLDLTHIDEKIGAEDLEKFDIQKDEIILLKTKNSFLGPEDAFKYDFIYLDHTGAEFLAAKGIKSIGVDYLGIERNQKGHESHLAFFKKQIPIIEGLRLGALQEERYFLSCLPINLLSLEAAPVRAVVVYR
ncbi:cyclase family protein [Candidatus Babeliales bacterium]|nr:cyclase family protein [Candidatus Babeliales bacterium]